MLRFFLTELLNCIRAGVALLDDFEPGVFDRAKEDGDGPFIDVEGRVSGIFGLFYGLCLSISSSCGVHLIVGVSDAMKVMKTVLNMIDSSSGVIKKSFFFNYCNFSKSPSPCILDILDSGRYYALKRVSVITQSSSRVSFRSIFSCKLCSRSRLKQF